MYLKGYSSRRNLPEDPHAEQLITGSTESKMPAELEQAEWIRRQKKQPLKPERTLAC